MDLWRTCPANPPCARDRHRQSGEPRLPALAGGRTRRLRRRPRRAGPRTGSRRRRHGTRRRREQGAPQAHRPRQRRRERHHGRRLQRSPRAWARFSSDDARHAGHAIGEIGALIESGRFSLPVAQTFPLAEVAQAHRVSEQGHAPGKLVLSAGRDCRYRASARRGRLAAPC
ncbi:MAG TPA: zinc-binding dehydrogenase [Streptosporangiaceae bacterium]|nr:zinc-binding dehydrogenase [Streptosporangiaceae bacterium]